MKKLMKNKNIVAVILVAILALGSMGLVFGEGLVETINNVIDSIVQGSPEGQKDKIKEKNIDKTEKVDIKTLEKEKQEKLEKDAQEVVLPQEISNTLSQKDAKKLEKGFRRLCADKKLKERQMEILAEGVMRNVEPLPAYALYDYMYENFFTVEDYNNALERIQNGEALETVLGEYAEIENSFVPRDISPEQIEYLLEKVKLNADDIAIADILSFRGVADFDAVCQRRAQNESWTDICADLGVLNDSGALGSISISGEEVKKCQEDLGLSQEEAKKKVIMAKKAEVKSEDIEKHIREGNPSGKALKAHFTEKYSD